MRKVCPRQTHCPAWDYNFDIERFIVIGRSTFMIVLCRPFGRRSIFARGESHEISDSG